MSARVFFWIGVFLGCSNLPAQIVTFGIPERLDAPVSSSGADFGSGISPDGEQLFFNYCSSFQADCDIHVAMRIDSEEGFEAAQPLAGSVNTSANELYPSLSLDGDRLYFADALAAPFDNFKRRQGGLGGGDIWLATKSSDGFGNVTSLPGDVNTSSLEAYPHIAPDGTMLLFSSNRSGGSGGLDLYTARCSGEQFVDVTNLGSAVNSSANEGRATISRDGLVLFFDSDRAGGSGNWDIWMATRTDPNLPFGNVQNLGPSINTPTLDSGPSLSADGTALYFESFRDPNLGLGSDLWRLPVSIEFEPSCADFTGDGACDGADIDALMNAVATGSNDFVFDLNADGSVDDGDRDQWLATAGISHGFADGYLVGDADLNGSVGAEDLNALALAGRTSNANWTSGNFTGANTDAADLNALALNWRSSVTGVNQAVPEPSAMALICVTLSWFVLARPRRSNPACSGIN